jgi:hypothetical protein
MESPGDDDTLGCPMKKLPRFLQKVIEPLRQSFELLRQVSIPVTPAE